MSRWFVVAVVTCGCHVVFGTDALPAEDAAGSPDVPLPSDAGCIGTTNHDEDGDFLVDNCDACPTVQSDDMDRDGDGLADACDPDLSTSIDGDKILRASLFAATSELGNDYDPSGVAVASIGNDEVTLPGGAQIALKTSVLPTKIVLQVTAFTGSALTDGVELGANGVSCNVRPVGCAGETNQICVAFNAIGVTHPVPASAIQRITIEHQQGTLRCAIESTATVSVTAPGAFQSSVPYVRSLGTTSVKLSSILYYGEK